MQRPAARRGSNRPARGRRVTGPGSPTATMSARSRAPHRGRGSRTGLPETGSALAAGTGLAVGVWLAAGCGLTDGLAPGRSVGAWLASGVTVGQGAGDSGAGDGVAGASTTVKRYFPRASSPSSAEKLTQRTSYSPGARLGSAIRWTRGRSGSLPPVAIVWPARVPELDGCPVGLEVLAEPGDQLGRRACDRVAGTG